MPGFVSDFIGSFVGVDGGGGGSYPTPPAQQELTSITTVSGTSITPDGSNSITIPTGFNGLSIWAGEFPIGQHTARVYYKKNGSLQTDPIDFHTYQKVTLNVTAGDVIAFGSKTCLRNNPNTFTDASVTLQVVSTKVAASHVAPADVTATVYPDRVSPNLWSPLAAHLLLSDEHQTIQISPASYHRDFFIMESKGDNLTPVRHVRVPANETTKIDCRYQFILIGSITETSLEITMPAGGTVNATGYRWTPDYTPVASTTVSTPGELKTAMNGSLYDDIMLNPGTYDMSGVNQINGTYFSTAWGRTLRIRSTTGNPADVVFTGSPWVVQIPNGHKWTIQDVTWNLNGVAKYGAYTGLVNFFGSVDISNFVFNGASTASDVTNILIESATGYNSTSTVSWGSINKSAADSITINQPSGTARLDIIGCYVDGNGDNSVTSNQQLITAHSGSTMACWGCRFGNLTTGNLSLIAADTDTTPMYFMYCRTRPEDFVTNIGVYINGNGTNNGSVLHFCDFQAFGSCDQLKSAIGTTVKTYAAGRPLMYCEPKHRWTGCDVYALASGANSDIVFDGFNGNMNLYGCRITHYAGFNQGILRMYWTTGSAIVGTVVNCLLRTKGTPVFNLATNSASFAFKNSLFVFGPGSGTTLETVTGTSATSSSTNCRFMQSSAPSGWSTAFPSVTATTFSTTIPNLDSNDLPTHLGNSADVDTSGADMGFVGSTDIFGKPWLGGVVPMGCVAGTAIANGQILAPDLWS